MRIPGFNEHVEKDYESEYQVLVQIAKRELSVIEASKIKIVKLAMDACTIQKGGHRGKNLYTLTRFAKDIGMTPKILNDWVHTYQNVLEPLGIEEPTKKEFAAARNTHKHLVKNSDKQLNREDVYNQMLNPKSDMNVSRKIEKTAKTLIFLLKDGKANGKLTQKAYKVLASLQETLEGYECN